MRLRDHGRLRRFVLTLAPLTCFLSLVPLGASPASAHPFGDPQTLEVSSERGDVRLRWRVGMPDDVTALAQHLGLLPADRVLLDGAVLHDDGDDDLVSGSPELTDYLLERLTVQVAEPGTDCVGEVIEHGDLVTEGIVLSFSCPRGDTESSDVDVDVRTMTDLHEAYRTLASGPSGQRAVYDAAHSAHTWTLSDVPDDQDSVARSATLQLGSWAAIVSIGAIAAAAYTRRRRRGHAVSSS